MQTSFDFNIQQPLKKDYPELLSVWEASVRTTHHFLKEEDIRFFKPLILHEYFDAVNLFSVCIENKIAGFLGTSADKIEMLFVHPAYQGKGIGKGLLHYAVYQLQKKLVDVNEQTIPAVSFYQHFGFRIINCSEIDGLGKPYPILHIQMN